MVACHTASPLSSYVHVSSGVRDAPAGVGGDHHFASAVFDQLSSSFDAAGDDHHLASALPNPRSPKGGSSLPSSSREDPSRGPRVRGALHSRPILGVGKAPPRLRHAWR
mmetsp:Transcript_31197/g.48247  ORF Transcript_31197/g.48247 Transcript_31197/m.48247 type:complete len:109 (-) Transcript_31197:172-498(-)